MLKSTHHVLLNIQEVWNLASASSPNFRGQPEARSPLGGIIAAESKKRGGESPSPQDAAVIAAAEVAGLAAAAEPHPSRLTYRMGSSHCVGPRRSIQQISHLRRSMTRLTTLPATARVGYLRMDSAHAPGPRNAAG